MTRKEYLAANNSASDTMAVHRAYYGQFVDAGILRTVSNFIGRSAIINSRDEWFNDIPLRRWDAVLIPIPARIDDKMRELGDYPTLAGAVCIAKEAARQIKEAALAEAGD
jgi:hypothetical protein